MALRSLNRLFDADASSKFALGRARINSALLSLTHLFDAGASSRLTFGRAQASLALRSLNRLLPRILVGYWAVLELLAADGYFLVVLLAVCPILIEVYAVAACTIDGLHG